MMVPAFLSELVRTVIIMSLTGGLLALLLLLIKPFVRHRLPKSAQYIFWLAALAAFLIPVSRIVTLPETIADITPIAPIHDVVERNVISTAEARVRPSVPNYAAPEIVNFPAAEREVPPAEEPGFITQAVTGFMVIYPLVFAFVLLCNLSGYAMFVKKLRRGRVTSHSFEIDILSGLTNGGRTPVLMVSDYAATPMLIGLFRPVIVLPNREYTAEQVQSILLHELTHLRRLDVAVKWLSFLACALHWFNPVVWITKREIDRICELSCDEAVIRGMDKHEKQKYGETLISVASTKKIPSSVLYTTMCEEKRTLKERLTAIMKSKKHTKAAILLSALILLTVIAVACTAGAGGSIGESTSTEENINPRNVENAVVTDLRQSPHDYAMRHIEEVKDGLNVFLTETETVRLANIIDTRINTMERLYVFESIEQYPIEMWRLDFMLQTDDLEDESLRWGTFSPDDEGWVGKHMGLHEADVIMVFAQPPEGLEYLGLVERWDAYEVTDEESAERVLTRFLELERTGVLPDADRPDYITIGGQQFSTDLTMMGLYWHEGVSMDEMTSLTNEDLLQLRHMTNLTHLAIDWDMSEVTNINALAGLRNLNHLSLGWNARLIDLSPLANLTNLRELSLIDCGIADLTYLAGLTDLTTLNLGGNRITDITPLANLTNLEILQLSSNQITDITPLENLTNLGALALALNEQLSDLSPLDSLTSLFDLYLINCSIADLTPLSGLENLLFLHLDNNIITDVTPLASLTNLNILGLSHNQLTDITPLASLTNLTNLNLGHNHITDLRPLSELANLNFLWIPETLVTDFSAVAHVDSVTTDTSPLP